VGIINQIITNIILRDVYNWTLYILQNVARNIKHKFKTKMKIHYYLRFILKPILMGGGTFNKMQGK